MNRLLRPFVDPQTYRAVAFYVAQLVLGVVGFTLLVAGWPITLVFCITPLVVPLLIGLRIGVGLLAQAQAGLARALLGVAVQTPATTEGPGFWSRGFNVLRDPMFWKQQAHLLLAWPTAMIPVVVLFQAGELITLPLWAPWVESYLVWGVFEVDSFAAALPFAGVGLVLLVGAVHLLGPYARLSRWLALRLLSGDPGPVRSPAEIRARRLRALTIDAIVSTVIVAALVVIWWLTTPGRVLLADLAADRDVARGRDPGLDRRGAREGRASAGSPSAARRSRSRSGPPPSSSASSSASGRSRPAATSGPSGRPSVSRCSRRCTPPSSTAGACTGSSSSRRAAPRRWTSRSPSCAGSSATCMTARRLDWSLSA